MQICININIYKYTYIYITCIYIYIHTYWTNSTHKHEIRHPIFPWPQYAAIKALRAFAFFPVQSDAIHNAYLPRPSKYHPRKWLKYVAMKLRRKTVKP
jgi:hypothetical protein